MSFFPKKILTTRKNTGSIFLMTTLLNPTASGFIAGIIHRNSVSVAERGPWALVGVEYADEQEDGESEDINGFTSTTIGGCGKRGGTCEVCSAAIVNIVRFRNAGGEQITVGVDCSETLLRNQDKLRFKAVVSAREKARRSAAKERKIERAKAVAPAKIAELELDRLAGLSGFAGDFSRSLRAQLKNGKSLSEKQIALAEKLRAENPA